MNTTEATTYEVGQHVHYAGWSDVYPGTVVKVTRTRVTVRRDTFARDPQWTPERVVGGFSSICTNNGEQRNVITEDADGREITFTRRGDGTFRMAGSKTTTLRDGWVAFHDYNF